MSSFRESYERAVENMGGIAGTSESIEYASKVEAAVDHAIDALKREAVHRANVDVNYLKGWLFEQWHAETLKISAAARGRDDVWAEVPGNNKPGYDVLFGDKQDAYGAELKVYKTAEDTAKAISQPEYFGKEKVVPSDQLEGVKEVAGKLAQKNQMNRPEQADNYQHTADHGTNHNTVGNATSMPQSEKDTAEMARDLRRDGDINPGKYGLNTENFVEWTDIARQAGEAGLHAAIMSAALTAAPHIFAVVNRSIETGEIDANELLVRGQAVLFGAGKAGLRGSVAAGLITACRTGLLGDSLKIVSPMAIGMATTLTLNAIGYSIRYKQGEISGRELAHHCMRDSFVLCTGMFGVTVGQLVIPIPVLGALAGNIVGSMLGALVFERTEQIILGICIESGWTYFGLVKQDYKIPEGLLREAGYDVFPTHSFPIESFPIESFPIQSFPINSLSFTPLRRGLISCRVVGYA